LPSELRVNGIYTFNEYSKKIGAKVSAPGQLDENSDADADGLIAAADNLPAEQRFDAFIIDEAQDFMRSWWNTIEHSLVDRANGKIAAFGDDQQRVFGTRLTPEFQFFKIRLHENIRNAKQIADLAAHFAKTQIAVRGPSAFPIDFIECPQNEVVSRADDYVAKLVDEDGWQPEEIVLLTTKSRHPVQIEMESHGGKEEYYQRLWSEGEVFYATVGGFKGLERSVVVLAIDGYHNAEDLDNFIYVGLTRARDKLAVIADPAMMQRLRRG
jgi:superfamily I DNA/RNA helicase